MSGTPALRVESLEEGILRLVLDRPKGNVIDAEMVAALREAVNGPCRAATVRAVIIEGEGPNFSFGASVEEHLPETVAEMLAGLHGLLKEMLESARLYIAVVRGHCLGGGLELASFCQRVFAAPGTKLGQPEIKLGVFAPVASVVLPMRVGQAAADDLLLTGRTIDAEDGLRIGLVDEIHEDPHEAAISYARDHFLPKSAASLALAVRAARAGFERAFRERIDTLERMYLDELMKTTDAEEGIRAFLDKRKPKWTHS